jgi:hypothetical protein
MALLRRIFCQHCAKPIGKDRLHAVVNADTVLCCDCTSIAGQHARYHPDCPRDWHDMWDHDLKLADRACTHLILSGRRPR